MSAEAAIERSPPESAVSDIIFLPGGCTEISMPVSERFSGSVCHIFA